jgi:hypothetical protein
LPHQLYADLDCLHCLIPCHRGLSGHIPCAARDFSPDETLKRRELKIYANVNNLHLGTGMPPQNIDARSSAKKIEYHLRGHFFGKCAYAFRDNTMVRGKGEYSFPGNARLELPGDAGNLPADVKQPSEAAARYGKLVKALLRFLQRRRIKRLYPFKRCLQIHRYSFLINSSPQRPQSSLRIDSFISAFSACSAVNHRFTHSPIF